MSRLVTAPARRALALIVGAGCVPLLLAACSSSGRTPVAAATSVTTLAKVTTTKTPDPNCFLHDRWSFAYLTLEQAPPAKPAPGQTVPTVVLDDASTKLKAAVPEIASSVDVRTTLLKKKLTGAELTPQEKTQDRDAAVAISKWHDPKC